MAVIRHLEATSETLAGDGLAPHQMFCGQLFHLWLQKQYHLQTRMTHGAAEVLQCFLLCLSYFEFLKSHTCGKLHAEASPFYLDRLFHSFYRWALKPYYQSGKGVPTSLPGRTRRWREKHRLKKVSPCVHYGPTPSPPFPSSPMQLTCKWPPLPAGPSGLRSR